MCQNSKQSNETFKKKLLDGRTKNLFILLISLWNTVKFRVLRLVEKSQNLIDQEHLDHISGTRNFPNMKFVQAYSNYSNMNFHYRPNWEKIKKLRKKAKLSYIYIQRTLGLTYFPILGQNIFFFFNLALSCTTRHGPLTPCWVPEKTKEPIRRKLPNRRTDRPYSYVLPFWPWPGFL